MFPDETVHPKLCEKSNFNLDIFYNSFRSVHRDLLLRSHALYNRPPKYRPSAAEEQLYTRVFHRSTSCACNRTHSRFARASMYRIKRGNALNNRFIHVATLRRLCTANDMSRCRRFGISPDTRPAIIFNFFMSTFPRALYTRIIWKCCSARRERRVVAGDIGPDKKERRKIEILTRAAKSSVLQFCWLRAFKKPSNFVSDANGRGASVPSFFAFQDPDQSFGMTAGFYGTRGRGAKLNRIYRDRARMT